MGRLPERSQAAVRRLYSAAGPSAAGLLAQLGGNGGVPSSSAGLALPNGIASASLPQVLFALGPPRTGLPE